METELLETLDFEALRAKARESLYFFTKGILGYDWLTPHIHLPVCEELQDFSNPKKLFELPRGWLKSTICTIAFPIWLSACINPNIRCLLVQNSSTNACKKLQVIGSQWEKNQLLRGMYPDLLPGRDNIWRADALCLTRSASFAEATYEAAGTSTRVVSRHYDLIVEDDTVAPDYDELGSEALAPTHDDVQKAIGWHRTNSLPLLNNPGTDLNVIVGTRWYDNDLIRYIKENEKHYKVVSRACREDEQGLPSAKGKITYPERFDENTLNQLESSLGPYLFSCLYLNTPVRAEDMTFKSEWFKFYEVEPARTRLAVYTTVDPATEPELAKSDDIDYNVVMTCGKDCDTGEIFVLDYFHERCNPGDLCKAIFDQAVKYRPIVVGYDNVAYQRTISYWLKTLMQQQGVYFIMEGIPRSGKDAKNLAIQALQPLFANGIIYLKSHMKALMSELLKFPLGAHDDLPDALSMQLQLWKRTKSLRQRKAEKYGRDPLNFEDALKALEAKNSRENLGSLIFDPMRTSSQMDTYGLQRTHA